MCVLFLFFQEDNMHQTISMILKSQDLINNNVCACIFLKGAYAPVKLKKKYFPKNKKLAKSVYLYNYTFRNLSKTINFIATK